MPVKKKALRMELVITKDSCLLIANNTLYDAEAIYGDENNKVGFFWIMNEEAHFGKSVSHHGGAFGMQNWLHIFPESNLGLWIITNQSGMETSGKLEGLKQEILNEIRTANGWDENK